MPTADVIPAALPSDSSDVADALDVARALFEKGQIEDAIRWVRNAIEAADQTGDAMRVATLARTVAELAGRGRASAAPNSAVAPVAETPPTSVPPAPVTPRAPSVTPRVAKPSAIPQPPPTPRELPVASKPPPPKPAPPKSGAPKSRTERVRVSVRTSVRDPNLLVVRPLAEGVAPPRGTRVGFLEMEEELQDVTDAIAEVESSR